MYIEFIHIFLFIFFMYYSNKTQKKIFNIFAIGVMISLMVSYFTDYTALMIVGIGLIIYLLWDTFYTGGTI